MKNEVNEPPNETLRDFDVYLMDDADHFAAKNDDKIVYNDQPYLEEPIQDN